MDAAKIQGFTWYKDEYTLKDDDTKEVVKVDLDERTYLTLVQRYKELFPVVPPVDPPVSPEDVPYDLEGYITEINTGLIDANYMNANLLSG